MISGTNLCRASVCPALLYQPGYILAQSIKWTPLTGGVLWIDYWRLNKGGVYGDCLCITSGAGSRLGSGAYRYVVMFGRCRMIWISYLGLALIVGLWVFAIWCQYHPERR